MNPSRSRLLFDLPSCYRIRIQGPLSAGGTSRLSEMTATMGRVTTRQQVTTLTCEVRDQAGLIGVLDLLYNMGFPLLRVERLGSLPPAEDPDLRGETTAADREPLGEEIQAGRTG